MVDDVGLKLVVVYLQFCKLAKFPIKIDQFKLKNIVIFRNKDTIILEYFGLFFLPPVISVVDLIRFPNFVTCIPHIKEMLSVRPFYVRFNNCQFRFRSIIFEKIFR